ncbi:MAG: hypothetical protein M1834_003719 [Cirrosporium novae-zelandiae]|nr:MAG: hypothetical protein M1834_003719 [Cirrosporium novae-zelandiae]
MGPRPSHHHRYPPNRPPTHRNLHPHDRDRDLDPPFMRPTSPPYGTDSRAYSLTQASHPTYSNHNLHPNRSYASLKNYRDVPIQRPRSPYAYPAPARLRRPGIRPPSPAMSDGPPPGWRGRPRFDPAFHGHSGQMPPFHPQRRAPYGYRSDMNTSVPSLIRSSTPTINPSPGSCATPPPQRALTPSVSICSAKAPSLSDRLQYPNSDSRNSRTHSPSPIYYDYTENFEEEHHFFRSDVSVLSLPFYAVDPSIPGNSRPPSSLYREAIAPEETFAGDVLGSERSPAELPGEPSSAPPPPYGNKIEAVGPISEPESSQQVDQIALANTSGLSVIKEMDVTEQVASLVASQEEGVDNTNSEDQGATIPVNPPPAPSKDVSDSAIVVRHVSYKKESQERRNSTRVSTATLERSESRRSRTSYFREVSQQVRISTSRHKSNLSSLSQSHSQHFPQIGPGSRLWKIPSLEFSRLTLSSKDDSSECRRHSLDDLSQVDDPDIIAPIAERAPSSSLGGRFSKILLLDDDLESAIEPTPITELKEDTLVSAPLPLPPMSLNIQPTEGGRKGRKSLDIIQKARSSSVQLERPFSVMSKATRSFGGRLPLLGNGSFGQALRSVSPRNSWLRTTRFSPDVSKVDASKVDTTRLDTTKLEASKLDVNKEEVAPNNGTPLQSSPSISMVAESQENISSAARLDRSPRIPSSVASFHAFAPPAELDSKALPHPFKPLFAEEMVDTDDKYPISPLRPSVISALDKGNDDDGQKLGLESGTITKTPSNLSEAPVLKVGANNPQAKGRTPSIKIEQPQMGSQDTKAHKLKLPKFRLKDFSSISVSNQPISTESYQSAYLGTENLPTKKIGSYGKNVLNNPYEAHPMRTADLFPPGGVNFAEVQSFFSDDSSQTPNKGTLRKRLSELRAMLPVSRASSANDMRGTDRVMTPSGLGRKSRGESRTSHTNNGTAGISNFGYSKRKVLERIRSWWHHREFRARFLGGTFKGKQDTATPESTE